MLFIRSQEDEPEKQNIMFVIFISIRHFGWNQMNVNYEFLYM